MSRKRSISTEMSVDKRVNRLIADGDFFAGMLYMLMIPHAEDDTTITGDVGELMMTVLPGARDVPLERAESAIEKMVGIGLILRYTDGRLAFPVKSFYKYQSYISVGKRVSEEEQRNSTLNTTEHIETPKNTEKHQTTPGIAEEQKGTAKNTVSPSPSPSPSPSLPPSHSPLGGVDTTPDISEDEDEGQQRERCDYAGIMLAYNRTCRSLPAIRDMTDERKRRMKAWGISVEEFLIFCQQVEASDFLTGRVQTDRQWTADFDWITAPKNRQKIIEGQYKNRGGEYRGVVRGNHQQPTGAVQESFVLNPAVWRAPNATGEPEEDINF